MIRPHSSTYTPQVFERKINGYKYRSRSPPRGSPQKDIETKERLSRPMPMSARKGKLQKSRNDVLINQARLPFSSKQYGKGREEGAGGDSATVDYTRFVKAQEEMRPNTAPPGAQDGGELFGTSPTDAGVTDGTATEAKSGTKGFPKRDKRRPKTAGSVRISNDSDLPMVEGKWDPSTGHLEGGLAEAFEDGPDDDASLGIMQDPGDEMSIADSIGEGDIIALEGEDLEKAKQEKRRNLATSRELEVIARNRLGRRSGRDLPRSWHVSRDCQTTPQTNSVQSATSFLAERVSDTSSPPIANVNCFSSNFLLFTSDYNNSPQTTVYTIPVIGINPGLQEVPRETDCGT